MNEVITLADACGVFNADDIIGKFVSIPIPRGRHFSYKTTSGRLNVISSDSMPATIVAQCFKASCSVNEECFHPVLYTTTNLIQNLKICGSDVPYPGKYLLDLACDIILQQPGLFRIRSVKETDFSLIRMFDPYIAVSEHPFWVNNIYKYGHKNPIKEVGLDCPHQFTGVRAVFSLLLSEVKIYDD